MSKKRNTKETPEILAFERKLEPSDALLFSGNWEDCDNPNKWPPITLKEKTVRGTVVHRLNPTKEDPARLNPDEEEANIQTVDVANLPENHDTLRVRFTLRVRPRFTEPTACDRKNYYERIKVIVDSYLAYDGLKELSRRYARNLASGRFLWKNRISAEQVEVRVDSLKRGESVQHWVFDSFSEALCEMRNWEPDAAGLSDLAALVAKGLLGQEHVLLRVTAFARVGPGQEVFPSQEFIQKPKGEKKEKGDKSKTLYHVGGTAALHSQKIGNALRTIDDWYEGADKNGPISVEAYGSVTSRGVAWRKSENKQDFYTLFDNWILKGVEPPAEQQHYVMAMLIRGGVFGEGAKEKGKNAKDE